MSSEDTPAQRERAALVDTFRELGPDAPTLCEGWTARELAAHLVVRERRLDAAPGIALPFLAGYTDRVTDDVAAHTMWDELLDQLAEGPPPWSPFKLLDSLVNAAEMFIHHEDVRRAAPGWEPRTLDDDLTATLRNPLKLMPRLTLRSAPATVILRDLDGKTVAKVGRGDTVVVTGEVSELLMFAVRDEARVDIDGDADLVAAVRDSRGGM